MFTDEQLEFINDNKSRVLIGNALAGTGKTTTLVEKFKGLGLYNILYLVYNRSMSVEAEREMKGLNHVAVCTFHSLAYKVIGHRYDKANKLTTSYTTMNVVQDLELYNGNEPDYEYAYNFLNLYNEFLLSGCYAVNEFLNDKTIEFSTKERIGKDFIRLFDKMANLEDETKITHDFYLFLYHMMKPSLKGFDIVAIDEAQDLSPIIKKILERYKGKIYLIGDTHQNIYSWRNTINLFDNYKDAKTINFTKSFRVSQPIADICNKMYKTILDKDLNMKGMNPNNEIVSEIDRNEQHAIICRRRMAIFDMAYDYAERGKFVAFEGGINKYGFDLLVEAWFFRIGKPPKNPFLKMFADWQEFESYVKESGDEEYGLLIHMLRIKGGKVVDMLNKIKEYTVTKYSNTYTVLFTTVHSSKGQTYNIPVIVNDDILNLNYIRAELATIDNPYYKELFIKDITEEINVTYVGITRGKHKIMLPRDILLWFYSNDDFIL